MINPLARLRRPFRLRAATALVLAVAVLLGAWGETRRQVAAYRLMSVPSFRVLIGVGAVAPHRRPEVPNTIPASYHQALRGVRDVHAERAAVARARTRLRDALTRGDQSAMRHALLLLSDLGPEAAAARREVARVASGAGWSPEKRRDQNLVRSQAVYVLGRIAQTDLAALRDLEKILRDEDETCGRTLWASVANMLPHDQGPSPTLARSLLDALARCPQDDLHAATRSRLVAALGRVALRDPRHVTDLTRVVQDPGEAGQTRADAIDALGMVAIREGRLEAPSLRVWLRPIAQDLTNDLDPGLRERAGLTLTRVDQMERVLRNRAERERLLAAERARDGHGPPRDGHGPDE